MAEFHASAERFIPVPAETVWTCLVDYGAHHLRYLPSMIRDVVIEEGGLGVGTVLRVRMSVAGQTKTFRAVVSEPEPGRVLEEHDPEGGTRFRFTVDPDGAGCRVRSEATSPVSPGLQGKVEALIGPPLIARQLEAELRGLDAYAVSLERSTAR